MISRYCQFFALDGCELFIELHKTECLIPFCKKSRKKPGDNGARSIIHSCANFSKTEEIAQPTKKIETTKKLKAITKKEHETTTPAQTRLNSHHRSVTEGAPMSYSEEKKEFISSLKKVAKMVKRERKGLVNMIFH